MEAGITRLTSNLWSHHYRIGHRGREPVLDGHHSFVYKSDHILLRRETNWAAAIELDPKLCKASAKVRAACSLGQTSHNTDLVLD